MLEEHRDWTFIDLEEQTVLIQSLGPLVSAFDIVLVPTLLNFENISHVVHHLRRLDR